MKFHVSREACCSQDDQLGPLESAYELNADATLRDLVEAVIGSGFLQFSSTHAVMDGQVGNEAVVRVLSTLSGQARSPRYLKPADLLARHVIGDGELRFGFVFHTDA